MHPIRLKTKSHSAAIKVLIQWLLILICSSSNLHAATSETPQPGWLTQSERLWLAQHPNITVGPDPHYPPLEYFDDAGHFVGISADYLREIENMLGIKFGTIKLPNWNEVIDRTKAQEIDMLSAVAETPSRKAYLNFTSSYLKFPAVIITRQQAIQHTTMAELDGKRVAVTKGYAVAEYVKTTYPNLTLIEVNSIEEGLSKLSFGELDAMICINAPALYYIEKNGIVNLHIAGLSGYFLEVAFATRKDWPMLNTIMQKALNAISSEKAKKIEEKWINPRLYIPWKPSQNQILWAIVTLMLSTLIIAISWNRTLKNKVAKKTKELHKHLKALELSRQETYVSEQRLRSIFNSADIGLFIHAGDGTIVDMNAKALSMYGVKSDDIKNITVANNLSAEDCCFDKVPVYWEKALNGQSQRFPWHAKRADNGAEFNVEICLTKLQIPEKDIILASIKDTSGETDKQNSRRFLLEETAPTIASYIQSLDEEIEKTLVACNMQSIASNSASSHPLSSLFGEFSGYLDDYIDCMLVSYKSRPIEHSTVDLSQLCSQVIELVRKAPSAQNISLDLKNLCEAASITTDEYRLKSALKHLLLLASIQATPDSVVTVVINTRENIKRPHSNAEDNNTIELTITQYGETFTSNQQNTGVDFDSTITENRQIKSCCSLYLMSQTLIESLDAKLTTESTPNIVTSFKLVFEADTTHQ